jgi:hypothetical protein
VSRKYQIPPFLAAITTQQSYEKWLSRKASAHVRRDRRRGNPSALIEAYKVEIHHAVMRSDGRDPYTGEMLDWSLIGKYANADSKEGRRAYKAKFALLPTVDHVGDGLGSPEFEICAWRTNDAKNDLSHSEFVDLCHRVVGHSESK